jgi:hypothetical protein
MTACRRPTSRHRRAYGDGRLWHPGLQRAVADTLAARLSPSPTRPRRRLHTAGLGQAPVERTSGHGCRNSTDSASRPPQATFARCGRSRRISSRCRQAQPRRRRRKAAPEHRRGHARGLEHSPGGTLGPWWAAGEGPQPRSMNSWPKLRRRRPPARGPGPAGEVTLDDEGAGRALRPISGTLASCDPPPASAGREDRPGGARCARSRSKVPWTSRIELRTSPRGGGSGDIRHVPASAQPDLHDRWVGLCGLMLAVAPSARLAVSRGVLRRRRAGGSRGAIPRWRSKRIPRENLPARAPCWNRRGVAATAYGRRHAEPHRVISPNGVARSRPSCPALETWFDRWLRGRRTTRRSSGSGRSTRPAAGSRRRARVNPPPARRRGRARMHVTPLQSVLFDPRDLPRRFVHLPTITPRSFVSGRPARPGRRGGREPCRSWAARLTTCSAAQASGGRAPACWPARPAPAERPRTGVGKMARSAQRGNALRLVAARVALPSGGAPRRCGPGSRGGGGAPADGRRAVRPDRHECLVWPPSEVLVVVTLDRLGSWQDVLSAAAAPLRDAAGERRRLRAWSPCSRDAPCRGSHAEAWRRSLTTPYAA